MKITVTGSAGKLGQWVVRALLEARDGEAHEVTAFDRASGPEQPGVRALAGDVEDLGQVCGAVAGADAIIHLAAIARPNVAPDDVTFRTNVMGAYNVHEAAYLLGVRRVVSASSQAILGWDYRRRDFPPAYLPVDEDHPVRPQDPYGLSKEVLEAVARSYARKGLETVVLRPNWIVTPEDRAELRRQGGRQATGFKMHSYIDVRDLATAFRLSVERPIAPGTVLFVVADDTTLAEPLSEALPRLMPAIGDQARHLTGSRAAISNARAREVLGWQPRPSWRETAD
jgi:nucleoside-diphosphate-sugar epimerase